MPKVLVTDSTFGRLDVEEAILLPLGAAIDARQCRNEADLLDAVAEADYVLTQFAPLTARVIQAMPRVRLIARYGVGVDNVDLDAARARGIPVCNVPGFCVDEVADHTLALLLDATRRIAANGRLVRDGGWGLTVPLDRMRSLRELTVGIVGFGRIGRAVADRLRGFGCRMLAYDPNVAAHEFDARGVAPSSLETLLAESDAVTLHCPSTPETRRLIHRESIATMKPGAILINVARGDVVETAALVEALRDGRIAAAGLDVADPEPLPADSPLRTMDNVLVTAHIASASSKAVRTLRESAAGAIARAIHGMPPMNVVNGVGA
ncbi:MAG TPA: C-terminal binding protein [Isosphaeraceae bacterium]|jgi:D-3-phosphoglycerate dehydrogenase|nr:C-terminal binding protein [Isosphaeraceae bacterium]